MTGTSETAQVLSNVPEEGPTHAHLPAMPQTAFRYANVAQFVGASVSRKVHERRIRVSCSEPALPVKAHEGDHRRHDSHHPRVPSLAGRLPRIVPDTGAHRYPFGCAPMAKPCVRSSCGADRDASAPTDGELPDISGRLGMREESNRLTTLGTDILVAPGRAHDGGLSSNIGTSLQVAGRGSHGASHGVASSPNSMPSKRRSSASSATVGRSWDDGDSWGEEASQQIDVSDPTHANPAATGSSTSLSKQRAELREMIRTALVDAAGSPELAFKSMDLNGSGNLCLSEFSDGVERFVINWRELTGLEKPRELFRVFDIHKTGRLSFAQCFPGGGKDRERDMMMSTGGFWQMWVESNRNFSPDMSRSPRWSAGGPKEELQFLFGAARARDDAMTQKKWMQSTIRRLKHGGRSDARCRQIVASHLPRGTGPKDRDDVPIFSAQEVRSCKQAYRGQVQDKVHHVHQIIHDMREQRQVLNVSRQQLATTIGAMGAKKREKEEKLKQSAASFLPVGFALSVSGAKSTLAEGAVADPVVEEAVHQHVAEPPRTKTDRELAQDFGMVQSEIEVLRQDFWTYCKKNSDRIGRKDFDHMVQVVNPGRTMCQSDMNEWWNIATRVVPDNSSADDESDAPEASCLIKLAMTSARERGVPREVQEQVLKSGNLKQDLDFARPADKRLCDFEQFVSWYSSSELRVS